MTTSKQDKIPDNLLGYYAGFISRLIAFVIDLAVINLSLLFIGWFLGIFLSFFEQGTVLDASLENITYINYAINLLLNPVFIALFIFGFIFIYFTFFWSFSGHTPGKAFMGLRVVPVHGGPMSLTRLTINDKPGKTLLPGPMLSIHGKPAPTKNFCHARFKNYNLAGKRGRKRSP
jgi:uncharacterized RDD family membrane protein YckC